MKKLQGRVAAITGAASGIGRALACELARHGCHLALSDVDEVGLEETRQRVAGSVGVSARRVDVASRDEMTRWAGQVESEHGAAHMIVNNAGVALIAGLRAVDYDDFEWLMNINFWGVVYGTRAFLPILEKQDEGHIVNISSVFGIVAAPLNGAYNAAKFAVRGFTEALRMELQLDGSAVGVTCVHPGGIKTNIARASRAAGHRIESQREDIVAEFDRHARTTPERCARTIVRGVRRNAARVLVGKDAMLADAVQRLAPESYQHLMRRLAAKRWQTVK